MSDQLCHVCFQQFPLKRVQGCGLLSAQNKQIQGHAEELGKPDKQIHGTASLACLNMADQAPVNVQFSRKPFLCITSLGAELADTIPAPFYVVNHSYALQSRILRDDSLRLEFMGISLCTAARRYWGSAAFPYNHGEKIAFP